MSNSRVIALAAGAFVTIAVFLTALALLIFFDYFEERYRIILVSIALGPVAMISVMVGYSVWWLVLFLLSLFLSDERQGQHK